MRGKIQFETNIWQEISLRDTIGTDESNDYGAYARFATTNDNTLFLPLPAAAELRSLRLTAGEVFKIRKAQVNGGRGTIFQFARLNPLEAPGTAARPTLVSPHGEPAIPKGPAAPTQETAGVTTVPTVATQPASTANGNTKPLPASPYEHSGQAAMLTQATNMLIDVLARCKEYSIRYNGMIGPEDVRTLMLSAYINMSKKPEGQR